MWRHSVQQTSISVTVHVRTAQTRAWRFCSCRFTRRASRLASLRTNSSSKTDCDKFSAKADSFLSFSSSSATFCCGPFDWTRGLCSLSNLFLNFCGIDCLVALFFFTSVWVFKPLVSDAISVHLLASRGFFRLAEPPRAQRVMLCQTYRRQFMSQQINSQNVKCF